MANTVITISRGYGSGGRDVGVKLSETLGIEYYDKALIKIASDESGINEALFGSNDEKIKNVLFKKGGAYKGYVFPPSSDDYVSDENLFSIQANVIKMLAKKESCIIIGRCADYVLRDFEKVCRVFIYAPHDYCVSQIVERFAVDRKEAERLVEKVNRERGRYYKYYTGHNWTEATNYDLCIDISRCGLDNAVSLVQKYLHDNF